MLGRNQKVYQILAYDYFDVVDIVWWESFFIEKNDIIANSTNGDFL